jgi:CBS domain containing-hemolysin-like protein
VLVTILIVIVLLLVNAFFVVAEFAIVGVQRSAVDARASRHDRLAKLVLSVLDDPKRKDLYIATAQIGITVASLGLGMYAERAIADWILGAIGRSTTARWFTGHGLASVLAVSILTYLHIVIGEMLPKSLALQSPERIALWLTPPMLWIQTLIYPFVLALNGVASLVLSPFGIRHEETTRMITTVRGCSSSSRSPKSRALRSESSQVLQELFEFGS